MGKVSPKTKQSKTSKLKRQLLRKTNKYLKPGALAQIRYYKAFSSKSCTGLGKKTTFFDTPGSGNDGVFLNKVRNENPLTMLSPPRFEFSPVIGSDDAVNRSSVLRTPKTPSADECEFDSRLEALPMDLLVKILCHLHHDQLRPLFHVSQRIRKAVEIARQVYFNYTTPDRSRLDMLSKRTPLPTEHWPFAHKGDRNGIMIRNSPHTPKAPRHGPRPPPRFKYAKMRPISVVLFQEAVFPPRCIVPSVLSRPICRSLASNRVLFNEDELCKAVAQNKLQ